eukprot:m.168490 g.168490  ORF g.168490 m.168490 type:complete len:313 (-) comp17789_c0_seq1:1367-2305(-)
MAEGGELGCTDTAGDEFTTSSLIAELGADLGALYVAANPDSRNHADGTGPVPSKAVRNAISKRTSHDHANCRTWGQRYLDQQLCDAICSRDTKAVGRLLDEGANVNAVGLYNQSPLHLAVTTGSADVCQLLLAHGADVNCQEKFGHTPLHWACSGNNVAVAKILLSHSPNLSLKDDDGASALHLAAVLGHADIVSLLLAGGADVDARDHIGSTPLHYVAESPVADNVAISTGGEIAKLLLEKGAASEAVNAVGNTPLHRACRMNQFDVTWVLLAFMVNTAPINDEGLSPRDLAMHAGHTRLAMLFREARGSS